MNKYIAFYRTRKIEVEAEIAIDARDTAAAIFKAKKPWEVTVKLAYSEERRALVPLDPASL